MLQKQKLFLQKKRDPRFFMNNADPFLSKSPLMKAEHDRHVYLVANMHCLCMIFSRSCLDCLALDGIFCF